MNEELGNQSIGVDEEKILKRKWLLIIGIVLILFAVIYGALVVLSHYNRRVNTFIRNISPTCQQWDVLDSGENEKCACLGAMVDNHFIYSQGGTIDCFGLVISPMKKKIPDSGVGALNWDGAKINFGQHSILTTRIPPMQVSDGAAFGHRIGESGYFKTVLISPDATKIAFSTSNGVHDFAWVYDFDNEEFIPLSFQYGGGASVIRWEDNNSVTFELKTPKSSTEIKTFDLNNLSDYPRVVTKGEFSYELYEPYSEARTRLIQNGWDYYDSEGFKRAGISGYPEIDDCGLGVDAVCHVNFVQDGSVRHLNVQVGGRREYQVWTVVGDE